MWLRRLILPVFGLSVLGGYAGVMGANVQPFSGAQKSVLPPQSRTNPAAYRAPIFWSAMAFRGGK